jgi:AraC family transcriptional regulator of adaptative response/methylated-DNA-[protein]-cysteine methyltransferase
MIRLHDLSTPIGDMLAATADRTLVMLEFADRFPLERHLRVLGKRFPHARFDRCPPPAALRDWSEAWFGGRFIPLDLGLDGGGTAFQREVWRELRAIPVGVTRSYQEIAARLQRPTAVRAVARANGQNPLSIVIPCHRVIGADGSLTGYGGGLWRKRWLLEHEGLTVPEAPAR